ncbi:MAG: ABC transporter ATP-binding protein, partial [Hyphomicrobiales bacterium]|nr:ABC transporter ATP-binding protein [Hyphomicrobiales bacterium]
MAEPVLEIIDLSKSFGGIHATRNVSLDVREHETHAVIGPNGAGKTTLISQLSGSLRPDSGRILFKGRDITYAPEYKRSLGGLARSFQITSLLMSMSVLDNVALSVQAHDGHSFRFWRPARSESCLREPAMKVLEQVGLQARARDLTSALSHGERRQLEIAVALAGTPDLLLLDEPMAGMGQEESGRMVEILRGLKQEKSILLIEHDMDAVFALADRISVMVYGEVIATGSPEEIRANADVRRAY